jgi:hypothetical protein
VWKVISGYPSRLDGPAHRCFAHRHQLIEGIEQAVTKWIAQTRDGLSFQRPEPVAGTCSRNAGRGRLLLYQIGQSRADGLDGRLKSIEIATRLEPYYTAALRTTIAAQQETICKSIKTGLNKSMPPRPSRIAPRAGFRSGPQIILALLTNFLEDYEDRQYHWIHLLGVRHVPVCFGRRVLRKLPPFLHKKKASPVRPIYSDTTRFPVNLF